MKIIWAHSSTTCFSCCKMSCKHVSYIFVNCLYRRCGHLQQLSHLIVEQVSSEYFKCVEIDLTYGPVKCDRSFYHCRMLRAFIFASVCVLFSPSRQRRTVSAPTPASLTASTDRPLEAGPRSWTSTDTPFMCPTTRRRRCSSLTLLMTDSSTVPLLMRENLPGYHGFCAGPGDQLALAASDFSVQSLLSFHNIHFSF